MALTVTNTNTITLLNILHRNTLDQADTLRQLSTGKRINAGRDDPAGFIALSILNSELNTVGAALTNNQRTDSMLTVIDSSLGEIGALLGQIEQLVFASASDANLSAAEIAANQAQIDDALASIDRIVQTATFNGRKLLDGTFSILTDGVSTNADVSNLRVFSRGQQSEDTVLNVALVTSAQRATTVFAEMGSDTTKFRTTGDTEFVVRGALGAATLSLTSAMTQAEVIAAINAAKAQTGVSATGDADEITLHSTTFGSDAFISVDVLSGGKINSQFDLGNDDNDLTNDIQNTVRATGAEVVVQINGQTAGAGGLDIVYSANGLSLGFTLSEDFATGATQNDTTSFTVKAAGGATFQLGTTTDTRQTIGIDPLMTHFLGGGNGTERLSELRSGGSADLQSDPAAALSSVRSATGQLAAIRGRIGGFQKFQVGSTINSLQAAQIALTEAAGNLGDTDFALATAKLNREQVLIQAGIALLGVANQQSAQILALLQ